MFIQVLSWNELIVFVVRNPRHTRGNGFAVSIESVICNLPCDVMMDMVERVTRAYIWRHRHWVPVATNKKINRSVNKLGNVPQ